jgi:PAS domain S-box-containing protein
LLRFANDIILLMDQDGMLLDANDAAINTYGWSMDELLKLNVGNLRDPSTLMDFATHSRMITPQGLFETTIALSEYSQYALFCGADMPY